MQSICSNLRQLFWKAVTGYIHISDEMGIVATRYLWNPHVEQDICEHLVAKRLRLIPQGKVEKLIQAVIRCLSWHHFGGSIDMALSENEYYIFVYPSPSHGWSAYFPIALSCHFFIIFSYMFSGCSTFSDKHTYNNNNINDNSSNYSKYIYTYLYCNIYIYIYMYIYIYISYYLPSINYLINHLLVILPCYCITVLKGSPPRLTSQACGRADRAGLGRWELWSRCDVV